MTDPLQLADRIDPRIRYPNLLEHQLAPITVADLIAASDALRLHAWRPITEAPKDGTRILCYLHNARNPKVQIMRWHQPGNPDRAGYWIGADWPGEASHTTAVWQPLPQPPVQP